MDFCRIGLKAKCLCQDLGQDLFTFICCLFESASGSNLELWQSSNAVPTNLKAFFSFFEGSQVLFLSSRLEEHLHMSLCSIYSGRIWLGNSKGDPAILFYIFSNISKFLIVLWTLEGADWAAYFQRVGSTVKITICSNLERTNPNISCKIVIKHREAELISSR